MPDRYRVLDLRAGDVDRGTRLGFGAQKSGGNGCRTDRPFWLFLWNGFVSKYHVGVRGGSPRMGLEFHYPVGSLRSGIHFYGIYSKRRTISGKREY